MIYKILFPDSLHFHSRNFKSLMSLLSLQNYDAVYISDQDDLKSRYGDYSDIELFFSDTVKILHQLDESDIFDYEYAGIRIFPLIKAELLSYLMPQKGWIDSHIESDERSIFRRAYSQNKKDLLLNISVGIFWLDFWKEKIREAKNIKACCIFSGSLTYVKTLSYLLQNTSVKVFVLEHFYTGNEYYFEEKYEHIANNSDIRFRNVFNKLNRDFYELDAPSRQSEEIKAINKLKLKKNKNVKQPKATGDRVFSNPHHTVLIIGQVINDFSILETSQKNINSLQSYLDLIEIIIKETRFNVIFKAHPWENQKTNIKKPLTKEKILDFASESFSKQQHRLVVLEDYNLDSLINQSKHVIGLCSQSLIEATMLGKKTIQMGRAFFGGYGFTHDCSNVEQVISIICNDEHSGNLTTSEYKNFLLFATLLNQFHLVSVFDSGVPMLKRKLKENTSIPLVQDKNSSTFMQFSYKESCRDMPVKEYIDFVLDDSNESRNFVKRVIEVAILLVTSNKKLKKFSSNPRVFFGDSKNRAVRLAGKLYFK
jgi:hypothetical protein